MLAGRRAAELGDVRYPWEDLDSDASNSYALRRTFGQPGKPRIKLYRDHAAWCPYW